MAANHDPRPSDGPGLFGTVDSFFRQAVQTFRTTGAIIPSGAALASELARYVAQRNDPASSLSILEAGPGTGPVSRAIAARMRPGDAVDLVEANPVFVEHLTRLVKSDPVFQPIADRVTIHPTLVTELGTDRQFDVIISGLPFANFTADEVRTIMEYYFSVLRPGGYVSFFSYLYLKQVTAVVSPLDDYLRRVRSGWEVREWVNRYAVDQVHVYRNIPPACVFHLRKPL